jgi:hypothetical protein
VLKAVAELEQEMVEVEVELEEGLEVVVHL